MIVRSILYKSKVLADGSHPILIQLSRNNRRKKISTGYSATADQWDFDEDRLRTRLKKNPHKQAKEINSFLEERIKFFKKLETELNLQTQGKFSLDELASAYKEFTKPKEKITIYNHWTKIIKELEEKDRIGNALAYKTARNAFFKRNPNPKTGQKYSSYNANEKLEFEDLTTKILEDYKKWLKDNVNDRSVFNYLTHFRAVVNKAIKDGITNNYPFRDFSIKAGISLKTKKRALSKEDMHKIFNATPTNPKESFYQKIFAFSYYSYGMNLVDIAKLEWNQIDETYFEYFRTKLKTPITKLDDTKIVVAINDRIQKILNHFKGIGYSNYVFPIFNENHQDEKQKRTRLQTVNKELSKHLNAIARRVGITTNITSYVARHSFASIMYRGKNDINIVKELLNHKNEKTTNTYLEELSINEKRDLTDIL